MLIRIRETGEVITDRQFRSAHPSTSFPPQLTLETLDHFGADPVLEGPQPIGQPWQSSHRDGVIFANGIWLTKYSLTPDTPEIQAAWVAARQQALKESVLRETEAALNAFAQTRNYENILSACSYVASTDPVFAAEAAYCVQLRDSTWRALYVIMAELEAGTRPIPNSYDDIKGELPVTTAAWPE